MSLEIRVAKTKALISFAVTAKLICVFVFAYIHKPGFLMTMLAYLLPVNEYKAGYMHNCLSASCTDVVRKSVIQNVYTLSLEQVDGFWPNVRYCSIVTQ